MTEPRYYLKKDDFQYTYTTKMYPYVHKDLMQARLTLNRILYNHFTAEVIMKGLGKRRHSSGFNISFSIHFLIFLHDDLKKEGLEDMLLHLMKDYIVEKEKVSMETMPKSRYTIKLFSYMQGIIRSFVKRLNDTLKENFRESVVENVLFSEKRWYHVGFNYSLAMEFLCYLLKDLTSREIDVDELIVPSMMRFFKHLNEMRVKDD